MEAAIRTVFMTALVCRTVPATLAMRYSVQTAPRSTIVQQQTEVVHTYALILALDCRPALVTTATPAWGLSVLSSIIATVIMVAVSKCACIAGPELQPARAIRVMLHLAPRALLLTTAPRIMAGAAKYV